MGRDQIVKAALELLDTEGTDGLSMRRLGARLGSGATSIYWYVANKDQLLELAMDEIMGEVPLPEGDDWRATGKALATGMRDVILRHPWITSLFGLRPNIGPNAMRLIDRTLASLTAAGFDAREATYAASLLSAHAIGSATTESAWHTAVARSGMSAEDLARSIEDYERAMAGDYPHLDSWTREVGPLDVGELQKQTFAYGLDRILDGLEASVRCSRH